MTMDEQGRISRRTALGLGLSLAATAGCSVITGSGAEPPAEAQVTETITLDDGLVAAAKGEGTLLVRNGTPANTMEGLAQAFTDQYGIEVQTDRKVGVVGTDQFRQEEQAGNHVVDVMWNVDPPGAVELADQGYLQRYTFPDIDRLLPPEARLGDDAAYVSYWYDVVIQYNPALISAAEAQEKFATWDGLLDDDLAGGRIGLNEPAGGAVPYGTYQTFYQDERYGRAFLEALADQDPKLYSGSAPGREALAAGEIAVYIPNWEDIAMLNFEQGDQTQWTYPDVVPSIPGAFAAISSQAPNPSAARLFTAWLFSEDGARALMRLQGRPTRLGTDDERTAIADLEQTDWWRPLPKDRLRVPDMDTWVEDYDELMPDMRRVLGWTG